VTDESDSLYVPYIEKNKITYAIAQANAAQLYSGGIPHAFLIDAKGIIAWEGHPGELQHSQIEAALKGARQAGGLPDGLSSVDKLMATEQFGKAHAETKKLLAGNALSDEARSAAVALCEELEKTCVDLTTSGLAAYEAKDWYRASADLSQAKKYQGLPRSEEAIAKLAELAANGVARKEIQAGEKFAQAEELEQAKDFDKAHKAYAGVVSAFAGTKAATDAAARRDALEKDGKLGYVKSCSTCGDLGYACPAHKKKKK
jgi:hypothetical protein